MTITSIILTGVTAAAVVFAGALLFPLAFADRITTPVVVLGEPLLGTHLGDLPGVLNNLSGALAAEAFPLELRGQTPPLTLGELGVELDIPATAQAIHRVSHSATLKPFSLIPEIRINRGKLAQQTKEQFKSSIRQPKNASLIIRGDQVQLVKSQPGEAIDSAALVQDIRFALGSNSPQSLALHIVPTPAEVQDNEVTHARDLATGLLEQGLVLKFEDQTFPLNAAELARLIEFVEQVDLQQPENYILGVRLHPDRLRARLTQIAKEIDREPVNAKFEISQNEEEEPRVQEFAAPQRGLTVNIDASAAKVAQAISVGEGQVPLVVAVASPEIAAEADLKNLGIVGLLARGESNFAGSPRNRIHNIAVGTSRYHGLLIPPEAEFSFNEHLGPVTGAAGFKPELVIKAHETIPEFGGGLCQVSTTAFRAAIYSGLEITERKNHAYAVRYYGIPGFDATIYPGYTDLRFRNNTPGHILVQTKIEGSKLIFEFWGTPDGREIEVEGPTPYNRRLDGAVKATLVQRVKKDGQVVAEKSFASNYRSPNLFPKVLAANAAQPTPTFTPSPIEGPIKSSPPATPTPKPKPSRAPAFTPSAVEGPDS